MSVDYTLYNYLKEKLDVVRLTVRHDETSIRCPYCGDSRKSDKSTHLYIKNEPPFPYYCHKCTASGSVNGEFLSKVEAYDGEMAKYLYQALESHQSKLNYKYGIPVKSFIKKDPILSPNQYTDREMIKLEYIEKRIGIEGYFQSEKDLDKFNIILNLQDFLSNNKINYDNYPVNTKSAILTMNDYHCMFLLNGRSMVNGRDIRPDISKKERFYRLNLFEGLESKRNFYSIKKPITLDKRVYNIHLTEGIFDIISLYANDIIDKEGDNNIYIANNGKGYLGVLNYIQQLGILNCNINIYSDNDVEVDKIKKFLRKNILCRFNGVNVFYNEYNKVDPIIKDFGVPKNKIILSEPIQLTF